MPCAHKQLCHSCKSFDVLLHIMKSTEMDLSWTPEVCLHPQGHPYPYPHLYPHLLHCLHICSLLRLLGQLPRSLPLCHSAIDLSWREPSGWLKASAASEPLNHPSSLLSSPGAIGYSSPSITAKTVSPTHESEGVQAFGMVYKHLPESDKTSRPQELCVCVR